MSIVPVIPALATVKLPVACEEECARIAWRPPMAWTYLSTISRAAGNPTERTGRSPVCCRSVGVCGVGGAGFAGAAACAERSALAHNASANAENQLRMIQELLEGGHRRS